MTASSAAAAAASEWGAAIATDFEHRYRAATRHSHVVRLLRVGLPAFAAVCLFILLAIWLNPFQAAPEPPAKMSSSSTVSGSKITMELPRLAGFTRDSRAYEFHARSAAQDLKAPNMVELTDIRAKLEMDNKTTVEMTAPSGLFESSAERLTLSNDIILKSSTGHEGRLREAVIDIRSGQIVSESPIELKFLNGTLNANRLEMGRNGDVIRFDGGVTTVLTMGKPDAPAADATAGR